MNLTGKVALITGGTRMGGVIAQALGQRGCRVVLTWRNSRESVGKAAATLREQGIETAMFRCDVSQETSIRRLIQSIDRQFGRLDVLINMASNYERTRWAGKDLAKSWDRHLATDARGAYLMTIQAAPLMKRSGGGRVIQISDWTSVSGRPRYTEYAEYYIAKAAVKAATEVLALELAPSILVNAIAPGPILPPAEMSDRERKAVSQVTPLRRWGGPEEIAKAVLFLIETGFVTGETLRVDGGRHLF